MDYTTLLPYLNNYDLLEVGNGVQSVVLHPVTINVNFQPTIKHHKNDYNNKWN